MNAQRQTILILLSLFVLASIVYWTHLGGQYYIALRDSLYLLTSFCGIIAGVSSLRLYGLRGTRSKTILLCTIGIGCWFVGELLYDYFELIHINPFPSLADFFYLLAYPLLFFGLLNEIMSAQVNWKKLHAAIFFLLSVASASLILLVLYFGVFQAYDAKESLFTNIIAMGYGVGDLLLILVNMCVLVLAWEFRGGKLSRTWIIFFISFLFTLIADILFAMYTGQYKAQIALYRNSLDALWMISYLLFAYGLFDFGFSIKEAQHKILDFKPRS